MRRHPEDTMRQVLRGIGAQDYTEWDKEYRKGKGIYKENRYNDTTNIGI